MTMTMPTTRPTTVPIPVLRVAPTLSPSRGLPAESDNRFGFCYAALRVCGALAVLQAAPEDARLGALARRTEAGIVHRRPLREGIHAWLSGDYRGFGPLNLTGGYVLRALTPGDLTAGDLAADDLAADDLDGSGIAAEDLTDLPEVYGQVVFTGFDGRSPLGLTAVQCAAVAHALALALAQQRAQHLQAAYGTW